jgi:hypothetical protein
MDPALCAYLGTTSIGLLLGIFSICSLRCSCWHCLVICLTHGYFYLVGFGEARPPYSIFWWLDAAKPPPTTRKRVCEGAASRAPHFAVTLLLLTKGLSKRHFALYNQATAFSFH